MGSVTFCDQQYAFLATALATHREKKVAIGIAITTVVMFAAVVPFVREHLTPYPAFIPSYEMALFFLDVVTPVFLFDQFARLPAKFAVTYNVDMLSELILQSSDHRLT